MTVRVQMCLQPVTLTDHRSRTRVACSERSRRLFHDVETLIVLQLRRPPTHTWSLRWVVPADDWTKERH